MVACTPFVHVACRMSQKLNFLLLLQRQAPCRAQYSTRQFATGSFFNFLVTAQLSQIACRVAEKYCELLRRVQYQTEMVQEHSTILALRLVSRVHKPECATVHIRSETAQFVHYVTLMRSAKPRLAYSTNCHVS